jgi:proline iminopeptidase
MLKIMVDSSDRTSPIDLHVSVCGSGFPLLCLHGHPGSGRSMSVFADRLSRRFQTLSPDLRGYGRSRASGDFEMSDHLGDLDALLDRHGIGQFAVLGWSLGGILAIELALPHPGRVTGLILVASAARPRGNHPSVSWQDLLYTGVAGLINRVVPAWSWNIETFGKRSLLRYLLGEHTPEAYRYLASEGMDAYLRTSSAATRALNRALRARYDRSADLGRIDCPALVMAGAADCHITAESSWETASLLPGARWQCYPNNAHLFPWEIPDRAIAVVEGWVEENWHAIVPSS